MYWSIIDDDKYIMAMSTESETSETASLDDNSNATETDATEAA